jgi:23S rRNA pseudouridine955/2504/2580 synthase
MMDKPWYISLVGMTILPAAADDQGRRLDRVLRRALPELPLSLIHRLLREGKVLVDGRPQSGDFRLREGQEIALPLRRREGPAALFAVPPPVSAPSPSPALRIIYEDADLLALNKEAGMEVHGSGESLEALVRAYLAPKLPPSLSFRPGPLHRLDRPTSGVLVFSVSLSGARYFSALLREGKIRKFYLALVEGAIGQAGSWEDSLFRDREARRTLVSAEGKPARTRFFPLGTCAGTGGVYSLLILEPETGRSHQIRAQAAVRGHPLGGDRTYGGRPLPAAFFFPVVPAAPAAVPPPAGGGSSERPPFLLHAWKLIPGETGFIPSLEAAPPDYFRDLIEKLFGPVLSGRFDV